MPLLTIGLLISSVLLTSCGVFQAKPEPCDCGKGFDILKGETDKGLDALQDVGNLRQQLKACQEKR